MAGALAAIKMMLGDLNSADLLNVLQTELGTTERQDTLAGLSEWAGSQLLSGTTPAEKEIGEGIEDLSNDLLYTKLQEELAKEDRLGVLQCLVDWAVPEKVYAPAAAITKVRFTGTVSSYDEDSKTGTITCSESEEIFGADVLIEGDQVRKGVRVDDQLSFAILRDASHNPQAFDVVNETMIVKEANNKEKRETRKGKGREGKGNGKKRKREQGEDGEELAEEGGEAPADGEVAGEEGQEGERAEGKQKRKRGGKGKDRKGREKGERDGQKGEGRDRNGKSRKGGEKGERGGKGDHKGDRKGPLKGGFKNRLATMMRDGGKIGKGGQSTGLAGMGLSVKPSSSPGHVVRAPMGKHSVKGRILPQGLAAMTPQGKGSMLSQGKGNSSLALSLLRQRQLSGGTPGSMPTQFGAVRPIRVMRPGQGSAAAHVRPPSYQPAGFAGKQNAVKGSVIPGKGFGKHGGVGKSGKASGKGAGKSENICWSFRNGSCWKADCPWSHT